MRTLQEQHRVSIVIPTLDAADELPATLAALDAPELIREIIVADGGSGDATVDIARAAGASVVTAPRGRGTQLGAGAAAASGEWLLFLHADSRPAPGWGNAVADFVSMLGAADRAGYFIFALDHPGRAARRIERLVAWRCRIFALPYGDQGLLIARRLYEAIGGFAAIPLMEDVDIVRRLGRARLRPIAVPILTSARRYRTGGYVRRPLRNLICLSLYLGGMPPQRLARLYG